MSQGDVRQLAVVLSLAIGFLSWGPQRALIAGQNETPARPQTTKPPEGGNQAPGAPGNQTSGNKMPAKPAEPPPPTGAPLYVSPGIVQYIQQKLLTLGYPVPTVSGAWGDNSAAALAKFQEKMGLDPGGDLDELTLLALEMPQVLQGDTPPGADAPVSDQAASSGGAPFSLSPRLTRVLQNKLTEAGYPTDNVFGIWMAGSDTAARAFEKAKGLEITSTLDLRIIHTLGLTSSLTNPKPGKLSSDSVAQILSEKALAFTGAPVFVGPAGIRQVQLSLQQRGHKGVVLDGKWSDQLAAELKKFQEAQKLDATGSLNLQTLKALGFNQPLADIDQQAAAGTRKG